MQWRCYSLLAIKSDGENIENGWSIRVTSLSACALAIKSVALT